MRARATLSPLHRIDISLGPSIPTPLPYFSGVGQLVPKSSKPRQGSRYLQRFANQMISRPPPILEYAEWNGSKLSGSTNPRRRISPPRSRSATVKQGSAPCLLSAMMTLRIGHEATIGRLIAASPRDTRPVPPSPCTWKPLILTAIANDGGVN